MPSDQDLHCLPFKSNFHIHPFERPTDQFRIKMADDFIEIWGRNCKKRITIQQKFTMSMICGTPLKNKFFFSYKIPKTVLAISGAIIP